MTFTICAYSLLKGFSYITKELPTRILETAIFKMFLWTSIPLSGEETCPCINGFLTVKALVGGWRYQNWRTLRITLKLHRTGGREQGHFCVVGGGKTKSNIQYDKLNVEYLMGAGCRHTLAMRGRTRKIFAISH